MILQCLIILRWFYFFVFFRAFYIFGCIYLRHFFLRFSSNQFFFVSFRKNGLKFFLLISNFLLEIFKHLIVQIPKALIKNFPWNVNNLNITFIKLLWEGLRIGQLCILSILVLYENSPGLSFENYKE